MEEGPIKIIGKYRYYMNRCLGEGSFGKVYEGFLEEARLRVAVKKMDFEEFQQSNYLQNAIMSQISILSRVKSPHIVEFKEVLSSKRSLYIITEFCEGGDLKQYLGERVRLSEEESWRIMTDLLKGFSVLQQHRIVHRDMKPANVLISNGNFKICDFGFAKNVQNFGKQMLRTIVGSPLYMAPQLLSKVKYTTKCDIWSLGIIWYEMLAGKTPWPAKNDLQLLQRIRSVRLDLDTPRIGAKSQALIRRMLIDDEDKRIGWEELMTSFGVKPADPQHRPIFNRIAQEKPARNPLQQDLQIKHFFVAELIAMGQIYKADPKLAELIERVVFLVSLCAVRKSNSALPQHPYILQTHESLPKNELGEQKRKNVLNDYLNKDLQALVKNLGSNARICELVVYLWQSAKNRPLGAVLGLTNTKQLCEVIGKGAEYVSFF